SRARGPAPGFLFRANDHCRAFAALDLAADRRTTFSADGNHHRLRVDWFIAVCLAGRTRVSGKPVSERRPGMGDPGAAPVACDLRLDPWTDSPLSLAGRAALDRDTFRPRRVVGAPPGNRVFALHGRRQHYAESEFLRGAIAGADRGVRGSHTPDLLGVSRHRVRHQPLWPHGQWARPISGQSAGNDDRSKTARTVDTVPHQAPAYHGPWRPASV